MKWQAGSIILLLAVGCTHSSSTGADQSRDQDQAKLEQLERDARRIANPSGCSGSGPCRAAPVGDRPCGGPRDYLVYCSLTTDSVQLFRKLNELRQAERAFNQKYGLASTCEFRTPPGVQVVAGSCQAVRDSGSSATRTGAAAMLSGSAAPIQATSR